MESPSEPLEREPIQYIEPTLLFTTQRIKIGEGDFFSEVAVSELVKKDQPLLEFTNTEQFEEYIVQKQPIETGGNCYFSEDENVLFSSIAGYPKIEYRNSFKLATRILHISVEPLFRITSDRMKCSISIHPPLENAHSLADEDLYELIAREGITSGLIPDQIQLAEEIIQQRLLEFNVIVFAKGKKAVNGTDAYLKFEMETGPLPGKILKDGTIDFRERKIFVPVSKSQVIARKVQPTQGTSGKTIMGERIDPKPGIDIAVNTLKDATYSLKTRKVTATADGVLSIVGDTIIKVCSRQEIMSDIDYATGHIESRNSVLIHGSVQPGFRIKTDGDLEIRGSVMSTQISSLSNIVIKSGITGKNSSVTAEGDIDIYFIEQGKLQAGSNCIIRKQSYYSRIIAGKNIHCTKDSTIVGGKVIAGGNLILGSIGSANASPALICAGVDGHRLLQYYDLQKKLIEQQEGLIQWLQMHKGSANARKIRKMEKGVEDTKLELLRMNMIPGTGIYSRAAEGDNPKKLRGEKYSDKGGIDIAEIYIEIYGIVYGGTKLQIGNRTLKIEHTIANRLFKLNDTLTEISAHPLKHRKSR
ncbi:DUF342 domain-containing protein [Desulfosediminicola flagellatus]|uniref:DUF342 domain-containing protein n=1 Tax=Desulfosediminicola flagellatus TaxID=2569541 RepID=UPI00142ECFE9|nr:FapA family protein [Desulfosediminicola flagellatus]